jgi:hypothetical protein
MIEQTHVKVNSLWLPAGSHTETAVRLSGLAVPSIEYRDYKIVEADPLTALDSTVATKPVLDQLAVPNRERASTMSLCFSMNQLAEQLKIAPPCAFNFDANTSTNTYVLSLIV